MKQKMLKQSNTIFPNLEFLEYQYLLVQSKQNHLLKHVQGRNLQSGKDYFNNLRTHYECNNCRVLTSFIHLNMKSNQRYAESLFFLSTQSFNTFCKRNFYWGVAIQEEQAIQICEWFQIICWQNGKNQGKDAQVMNGKIEKLEEGIFGQANGISYVFSSNKNITENQFFLPS